MKIMINLLAAIFLIGSLPAVALAFNPDKPVKIIIGLPPGSGPDVQLRKAAQLLSDKWKQPVVVENRPGAASLLAMQQLVNDPADGYSIGLFDKGALTAFPILYPDSKVLNNLSPLIPFFAGDMFLFTSPEIKNVSDLRRAFVKNPSYGSWAVGSTGHLAGADLARHLAPESHHSAYQKFTLWFIDTHNQVITFGFTSLASGRAMQESGKIHYLATAAKNRHPRFASVPTMKEAFGIDLLATSYLAFYVRNDVPAHIQKSLENDVRAAIGHPEMIKSLTDNYYSTMDGYSRREFQQLVVNDTKEYADQLRKLNITIK